jgi:hypothetical protein
MIFDYHFKTHDKLTKYVTNIEIKNVYLSNSTLFL